ncbi:hypothetical protein MUK42_34575 [Musa troglodytarum]|uniref:Uncharacterized protein n=1 Tax=Musa troglodytarum TaxID=320322 RepID=A0A9E7KX51_9LILI|nr:hypothetical protein MUK42_34575 [Musa troglodytarum]
MPIKQDQRRSLLGGRRSTCECRYRLFCYDAPTDTFPRFRSVNGKTSFELRRGGKPKTGESVSFVA